MTGYGRATAESDGREITVELRSVNHRFLDVAFRLPRSFAYLEEPARQAIAAVAARGHVDVFAAYKNRREDRYQLTVDKALALAYAKAVTELKGAIDLRDDVGLSKIMSLPDVIDLGEKEDDRDAVQVLFIEALSTALAGMNAMRRAEGGRLRSDMEEKLSELASYVDQVAERSPQIAKALVDKLNARLAELLGGTQLDPSRLHQEAALMADRAAIDEEIVRLRSHMRAFASECGQNGSVGKKLDFIIQEMNREVNTIGSKAADLEIGSIVIAAKAIIEKLREQVQNIE